MNPVSTNQAMCGGCGLCVAACPSGAIRTHEQAHMARLLRRKSKTVPAHGACAHLGGIVGLGNFHTVQALLTRSFVEIPTVKNPGAILLGEQMANSEKRPELSGLSNKVMTLNQVIQLDSYIPGCPPPLNSWARP